MEAGNIIQEDLFFSNQYLNLRIAKTVEHSGKFREYGFDKFEDWLAARTFIPKGKYRSYLRTARCFKKEVIDQIGFQHLDWITRNVIKTSDWPLLVDIILLDLKRNRKLMPLSDIKAFAKDHGMRQKARK